MTEKYNIVIVGAGGVGKSALVIQFVSRHFIEVYDPTIEDSYRKTADVDGKIVLIELLDTAGQEEYNCIRGQHMLGGDGFVIAYAINDKDSFLEVSRLREQIISIKNEQIFPMVLVGNKCDLENERKVSVEEARDLAKQFGIPFFECSAKKVINVDACFHEAVRAIRKFNAGNGPAKDEKGKGKKSKGCALL